LQQFSSYSGSESSRRAVKRRICLTCAGQKRQLPAQKREEPPE
jgi:hypothetical protein